jgi:hypothetical protein
MFIANTIPKSQKVEIIQMSTGEWVNQMWCVHTVGYYPVIKKECGTDTCFNLMNLENIMLSKRRQIQNTTHGMLPFTGNDQSRKGTERRCWEVTA